MIARDAQPIDHRPPYKRVDLAAKRARPRPTKQRITREEIEDNLEPMPDPEFYDQDFYGNWNLKP
jgi:hypothetical protein